MTSLASFIQLLQYIRQHYQRYCRLFPIEKYPFHFQISLQKIISLTHNFILGDYNLEFHDLCFYLY